MAGFCSCGQFGHRSESECTLYTNLAREAELNSGRQEKLPFAQLVIKPTIADNAYPGKLSEPGIPNLKHNAQYDVYVPLGGKIEVEPTKGFSGWCTVIVYDKAGIIQSINNRPESKIKGVPEKYADTDPDNNKLMSMRFYPAGTTEI